MKIHFSQNFNTILCDFIKVDPGTGENVFFWIEPTTLGDMEIEVIGQTPMTADKLSKIIPVEVGQYSSLPRKCF